MRCPRCGIESTSGRKFCPECGSPLSNRCAKCGANNSPTARFCEDCGAALTVTGPASTKSNDAPIRVVATPAAENIEGERKTVTALFADIKGSTELEQDLDPEEARAIVDPALKLMIDAVQRYDGYVVQSTGDGIFAIFVAPVAHEDHPQRASYAALRMQEELRRYSARLRERGDLPLEARVGANTGEVVVRPISTGQGHTEYTPIGHTANLASRMQALAPTGSIAVSESTRKLCEGYFALKPLGPTRVKGVSEPVNVYEVTGLGPLRTRLQRAAGRGLTKFVGRRREMNALADAAEQAQAGRGQIVAAMAEAGAGKSRLFFEFKAKHQSAWKVLETFSVSHGKASAYLPVIDLLHNYFKIAADDDEDSRRAKVIGAVLALDRALEDTLPYLLSLLGIVEGGEPPHDWQEKFDRLEEYLREVQPNDALTGMNAQVRKRRTLDAIKRIILRESLRQPLMVIFEDLHWIDEETQALLNLLADAIANARILLLVNYRPEYSHHRSSKTYYTQLRLDPLGRESADEMLSALLGTDPQLAPLRKMVADTTEGNPFFIEEMVQAMFEDGALVRDGPVRLARPLEALKVPTTVQGVLASRIDRLSAGDKDLLQTLAVIGKEFPLALAKAVTSMSDDQLGRMLERLQLAEFIYEQPAAGDVEYTFKHALTHEVAYNSVLMERRRAIHEIVAGAIERLSAGHLEDRYDELARHYHLSRNAPKAIHYLRMAGGQAASRGAAVRAADDFRAALEAVLTLPQGEARDRLEFSLQVDLASALTARSWADPEKERALARARELGRKMGPSPELFAVLWHLAEHHIGSGLLAQARALAVQCVEMAEQLGDSILLAGAHHVLGEACYWRGEISEAVDHLARAVSLCDLESNRKSIAIYGIGLRALAMPMLAYANIISGNLDQGAENVRAAVAETKALEHPYSLAFASAAGAWAAQASRDTGLAYELARSAIEISGSNEFSEMLTMARWVEAWVKNERNPTPETTAAMAAALDLGDTVGASPGQTWTRGAIAEALAELGRSDEAIELLRWVEAKAVASSENFAGAETRRIRGEIEAKQDPAQAEQRFREAITIARARGAKLLELRAATSLARLLRDSNRRDEARAILAEIYNSFTEGFGTADLKDAKALLDELNGSV
jgi:predicted ATPase/class 3 adenylate cyclase